MPNEKIDRDLQGMLTGGYPQLANDDFPSLPEHV